MKTQATKRLILSSIVLSGIAWSNVASAQSCPNSCSPAVTGPKDGVHTQFVGGSDAVLWPPNHKHKAISISAVNNDGDACNITITDARQDEPLNGPADGSTSPDATNCTNTGNDSLIALRAERAGNGDGRYYHVSFTMSDPDCPLLPAADEAIALVPHDQGVARLGLWIDGGGVYASYSSAALVCAP